MGSAQANQRRGFEADCRPARAAVGMRSSCCMHRGEMLARKRTAESMLEDAMKVMKMTVSMREWRSVLLL